MKASFGKSTENLLSPKQEIILESLAKHTRYGQEIQEIIKITLKISLLPGNLYLPLQNLIKMSMITQKREGVHVYYTITEKGKKYLKTRAEQRETLRKLIL